MTMALHCLTIEPRDLLFFRDGRPMSASDVGLGAAWPFPSILHDALTNGFHRTWPELQAWEHQHRMNEHDSRTTSARFGYLTTAGPWPQQGDTLFLPTPADLAVGGHLLAPLRGLAGSSNLPKPLQYPVGSLAAPSKESPPAFMSAAAYKAYLQGKPAELAKPQLFDAERQIGVAIDPETHGTVQGQLYSAEYLRLRGGVSMVAWAQAEYARPHTDQTTDALQAYAQTSPSFVLGGQQGVARLALVPAGTLPLPRSVLPTGDGNLVKWVLLSPAVFPAIGAHPGGWLPSWVDATTGQVLLKADAPARTPGERREAWRTRVANQPPIAAKLVAARIPKPLAFSGWSQKWANGNGAKGGPKPTYLAVPAGAVYYFQADSPEAARQLVAALAWDGRSDGTRIANRRSTLFGEKGFGLGACAPWNFLDLNTKSN